MSAKLHAILLSLLVLPHTEPRGVADWLLRFNIQAQEVSFKSVESQWNFTTNLTKHNQNVQTEHLLRRSDFLSAKREEANRLFDWKQYKDPVRREFLMITRKPLASLDEEKKEKVVHSKYAQELKNYPSGTGETAQGFCQIICSI